MGPSRLLDQLHDELNGLRTEQRKLFSIGFSSACSQSYPAWQVRLDRDDGTFQSDDSGGESLGMHRNPLHPKGETQQPKASLAQVRVCYNTGPSRQLSQGLG